MIYISLSSDELKEWRQVTVYVKVRFSINRKMQDSAPQMSVYFVVNLKMREYEKCSILADMQTI